MNKQKKTTNKSKLMVRIAALASLFQTGCASLPLFQKAADARPVEIQSSSHFVKKLTTTEKDFWKNFIRAYSRKSRAARKILNELIYQDAEMDFFDQGLDKDNLFWAGKSDENTLNLNRDIKNKGVSLPNTFFHEAEHVVHLKRARQNGINAASFASLDDVFIYATLLEALAYRKAALCCEEYKGTKNAQRLAEDVFLNRLKTTSKPIEERLSYEESALALSAFETNSLPNQVHFKKNPDWDQIVSLLSRGEVKKVPFLPQPTILFLSSCLNNELDKHPDAKGVEELDISCVLENKDVIQTQEVEIKRSISNFLMQIYDLSQKSQNPPSSEIKNRLLYLMGWPDAEQTRKIEQKEISFSQVRDLNLSRFKTEDLFDEAIKLIQSRDLQACQNPKINRYGQILTFEKKILIPNKSQQKVKAKQKVR